MPILYGGGDIVSFFHRMMQFKKFKVKAKVKEEVEDECDPDYPDAEYTVKFFANSATQTDETMPPIKVSYLWSMIWELKASLALERRERNKAVEELAALQKRLDMVGDVEKFKRDRHEAELQYKWLKHELGLLIEQKTNELYGTMEEVKFKDVDVDVDKKEAFSSSDDE
jgi:hypothetical protein